MPRVDEFQRCIILQSMDNHEGVKEIENQSIDISTKQSIRVH